MSRTQLKAICHKGSSSLRQKDVANDGPYAIYGAPGIIGYSSTYQFEHPYLAVVKDGAGVGRVMGLFIVECGWRRLGLLR